MRKLLALLVGLLVALALVLGAKTLLTPSRQLAVAAVQPVAVDAAAAAARLSAAVRMKTIASLTDPEFNGAAFSALHAHLEASFPKAHAVLRREAIGNFGLVYVWPGRQPTAPPIGLMAHQDVISIAPGTEADWQQPPFSGAIADGFVWGRGSWDDKGNLMSIMEAVELLAASGFQPQQTVYLMFGQDEEVGGERGAALMPKWLQAHGVHLRFVIDEGMLVAEGMLAGLNRPAALIGVAEKGHVTVRLTATASPGHSSMPPARAGQSAIGMLSSALVRLEEQQMPLALQGVTREMLETLAPEMVGMSRVLLSNLWLFRPIVEQQLGNGSATSASMRTTTALTVVSAGGAENAFPGNARASVNFRLLPGDSSDAAVAHVVKVVANPGIAVEKVSELAEPSKVSSTASFGYRLIAKTLRELHPDFVVAPSMMIGGTDSRYLDGVADDVYKFSPMRAGSEDLKRFHGTNERISIANYVELIQFYHRLLTNASAAP